MWADGDTRAEGRNGERQRLHGNNLIIQKSQINVALSSVSDGLQAR